MRLEAFGETRGRRVGVDAICLLASITKSITAIGVLQLVEEGSITLEQQINAWAPELCNAAWQPITAWHVLSHTTGIDDVDLELILRHRQGRDDLLRHLRAKSQVAAPGTRFHYVSFPFDLLVEALARRTGEPYEASLRRRVLEPLAMAATTFDPGVHAELAPRAAPLTMALPDGTFMDDDGLAAAYASLHLAGGGLWSSAEDLLRLGRAMLRGGELDGTRVLSPAFVDLMTREVTVPRMSRVAGLGSNDGPAARRTLRAGLGQAGRGVARIAGRLRARRGVRHPAVDRPSARPRVRLPQRRMGDVP